MGLVQGREDGVEMPWQEGRAALELEVLLPFPVSLSHPDACSLSAISPGSRDRGAGSISISDGEEQMLLGTNLMGVRYWRGHCGDSMHQVATMTRCSND